MHDPLGALNAVSPDGTPIAAYSGGAGPPLLLIHGTAQSDFFWRPLLPFVENRFTVWRMQRRGRGKSGDSATHSLRKEGEDVVSLINAIGERVTLFGHGYGANCALEATSATENVAKMVLYEPRVQFPYTEGSIARMEQLLQEGEQEEVILKFFAESDLSIEALIALRSEAAWQARFALANTIPRECRAESRFALDSRLAHLDVPTLLLSGSESSSPLKTGTEQLSSLLPNARVEIIDGQGHLVIGQAWETIGSLVSHLLSD